MTEKLPAYKLPNGSDFKALCELPFLTLHTDWFKTSAFGACHFALAASEIDLYMRVKVDKVAVRDEAAVPGAFTEGLWKFDCGELFIANNEGTAYQEFNVAPQGSWWSCAFENYRAQQTSQSDLEIKVYTRLQKTSWEAGFMVKKSRLKVMPERGNVTFVLANKSASGEIINQYISYASLSAKQPDFHLVTEYPEIDWR